MKNSSTLTRSTRSVKSITMQIHHHVWATQWTFRSWSSNSSSNELNILIQYLRFTPSWLLMHAHRWCSEWVWVVELCMDKSHNNHNNCLSIIVIFHSHSQTKLQFHISHTAWWKSLMRWAWIQFYFILFTLTFSMGSMDRKMRENWVFPLFKMSSLSIYQWWWEINTIKNHTNFWFPIPTLSA